MTVPDVVLVGYYGRGNFGDDVLMAVAHRIARSILPDASIGVRLGSDVSYPSRLLGENVIPVPFGSRDRHRLIIHGGGGTFFDFAHHSISERCVNAVLLIAGVNAFVRVEGWLRTFLKKPRMSAQKRIGLGIGVGTFSAGSGKLREALPLLMDFDGLWVRDPVSKENLDRLAVSAPITLGSDLAFLSEGWCPEELLLQARPARLGRPKVGVVLRDWPVGSGPGFANAFGPVIAELSAQYDLTLISFDSATDAGTLRALNDIPQVVWCPERMDLAKFSEVLSDHDVLLTSRAHGAICGACLGRPSVILDIEPKLKAVNSMLPRATRLVRPDSDSKTVVRLIEEALAIPIDSIVKDVMHNRTLAASALGEVLKGLNL
ncbi:polysaccharide pyruvyl transferase family protein [Marinobacter adhaerens]|uniref:Polysaccharide pyruvyl transferase-like protein n=1 Tax=Marinobacter adhaerens (strain DSM 23420 / HP15) TaxID=225937 RepID=E4PS18_MARAH|nr:polysaccharide pyruvyl transferase family protein [Marinobacter adhaerens]ADQ00053.1 polysaccharide pyruvyl transferase-like protein [Marinobacter adhaerens HP15]MBW4980242.1 polysaccharide pyruvyl transferase family protein [Marinobacter adhaerens]